MECYANKVLTIDDIYGNSNNPEYTIYKMLEDEHYWQWSISMFEGFTDGPFINLNRIV